MAENSVISWTDHTFNPWMGCTKVSPACAHCYAERGMDHRYKKVHWGPTGTRVVTSDVNWKLPERWNRQAKVSGVRNRVFCASLADVFEDWEGRITDHHGTIVQTLDDGTLLRDSDVPFGHPDATMDDVRKKLFDLIDSTPHLDWMLLTKRPENIMRMWVPANAEIMAKNVRKSRHGSYRDNVWLGTSVENQEYAEKRIPELLKCRDLSPVLFLSCEPLLGPLDLTSVSIKSIFTNAFDSIAGDELDSLRGELCSNKTGCLVADDLGRIDWVIAGGESGSNARPSHPGWLRSLRDQCQAAVVPFHLKQWGEYAPCKNFDKEEMCDMRIDFNGRDVTKLPGLHSESDAFMDRDGVKNTGRLLDGVLHDAFPKVTNNEI